MESTLEVKSNFSRTNQFENQILNQKNLFLDRNINEINSYQQVFSYDKPFVPNLSILDLIFNVGPFCRNWILASEN